MWNRTIILFVLAAALVTGVAGAKTYKWVDEQGQVHYSDQPRPGAEEIKLAPAPQAPPGGAGPVTPPSPPRGTKDPAETPFSYQLLSIVSPAQDQVLWNIGGTLTVNLQLQPNLQPGHGITMNYDGRPATGEPSTRLTFELQDAWRGTHTLQAAVVDPSGKTLIQSDTITFHIRQTSIIR